MNPGELASHILGKAKGSERFIVAIAGPPGAGKSTLAEAVRTEMLKQGEACAIVPMDGFHLDNRVLEQHGLLSRKGSPKTFDAHGFFNLITRLKDNKEDVAIPVFDRARDCAIADADVVQKADRIVLVEGNYLLLDHEPWARLRNHFDETIFINPGIEILKQRLIARWLEHGRDLDAAKEKALGNDIPNAVFVLMHSAPAHLTIDK